VVAGLVLVTLVAGLVVVEVGAGEEGEEVVVVLALEGVLVGLEEVERLVRVGLLVQLEALVVWLAGVVGLPVVAVAVV
jgi:hypothetical protein